MKKVVCPSCHVVQEVEESGEHFVCQECLKTHEVQQGGKIYNILYSQYVQLANNALNITKDFPKAKLNYERLIILDPTNLAAIFGLLEVKISLTKIHESSVNDVISSLELQKEYIFHELNDEFKILGQYISLLRRYEEYFSEAEKLLIKDDTLLNLAAKEKMISLIKDLILIYEYVQNILTAHYPNEEEHLNQIRQSLNAFETLLENTEQKAVLSNDLELPLELLEKKVISNKIKQYRLQFTLSILQFVFALGAIISGIIMFKKYSIDPFPSLISAGVFILLFAIAYVVLRLLKKRS